MPITMPVAVAAYFAAERRRDPDAIAGCFTERGVVRDEGGRFEGPAAIRQWNAEARERYHHTVEPLSAVGGHDSIVVMATVSGDFPNSPLTLEHTFRLQGDKIFSLDIR